MSGAQDCHDFEYVGRAAVRVHRVSGRARDPLGEVVALRRALAGGVYACTVCGLAAVQLDPWPAEDGPEEGWWGVGIDLESLSLQRSVPPCEGRRETA